MLPMLAMMTAPLWGLALFAVLPLGIALPLYVVVAGLGVASHALMARASRQPVLTGKEALVGMTATVVRWDQGTGTVRCHGELWRAYSEAERPPTTGDSVRVVAVRHLTLEVVPVG